MVTEADVSIAAMAWVFKHAPTKDATEQVVLLAIADHCDEHGGGAFPSLATLSRKTRLNRRSVIRVLARLTARGVVMVDPGSGRRNSNHYTLPIGDWCPTVTSEAAPVVTHGHQGSDSRSSAVVTDGHQGSDPGSPDPSLNRPLNSPRAGDTRAGASTNHRTPAFSGSIFDIPMPWAERKVRESNGSLSPDDITQFGLELTDACEREHREVEGGHLLAWLDRELEIWRAGRDEGQRAAADRRTAALDALREARRAAGGWS